MIKYLKGGHEKGDFFFGGVAIDPTCIYSKRLKCSANDNNAIIWWASTHVKRLECILNGPPGE